MTEKILFGLIGFLMFVIAGMGIYAFTRASTNGPELSSLSADSQRGASSQLPTNDPQSEITTQNSSVQSAPDQTNEAGDEEGGDDNDGGAQTTSNTTPSATAAQPSSATPPSTSSFTMAQVAAHGSASSCYTAIGGSVYDLTSFISAHPGGRAAILSLCGTDGTSAFSAQHGGQRRPANELASLKIGTLK